ncbi:MAG: amidase [Verrucomicrobiota bacterium]
MKTTRRPLNILNYKESGNVNRRDFLQRSLKGGLALYCFGLGSQSSPALAQTAPPPPDDLFYWSAARLARAIRDKLVSSEQVVQAHLDRIVQVNGTINAAVQVTAKRALAEARAADAALAQGKNPGALHGVPMTIKDSFDTEGVITTAGTRGREKFVPAQDATVVARLRAAGAVLLGKTNTPEFTFDGDTNNLVYGRTRNPFDLTRTPGGSSGGPATIVAVGGSPLDIGSDTVASIRWPAHCCGVAGIKPTSGRASLAGHIVGSGSPLGMLTQPGPISRYVEDLILILPIIAGPDPRDPIVQAKPLGNPASLDLKLLRVSFHTNNGIEAPTAEIAEVVRAAATALSGAVTDMVETYPSALSDTSAVTNGIFRLNGRQYFRDLLQAAGTSLSNAGPVLQYLSTSLTALTGAQITDAMARRDAFKQALLDFMQDYDVILCPVNAQLAPLPEGDLSTSYTQAYNVAGFPAAVVRGGTSSQGLPIGVQIVGRPWKEHVVLAVAQFLETALGGWKPVPLPVLKVQRLSTSSNLSWKGYGTLQSSEQIDGSWLELPKASAPYRVINNGSNRFYRVRQ